MSRLLAVEAPLLIFFPRAFVTTPSAQEFLFLLSQILQRIRKRAIFSAGSSESPLGDSSSDSTTLRAYDDFPLDDFPFDDIPLYEKYWWLFDHFET